MSENGSYSSGFTEPLVFTERWYFLLYSTNYHISAILGGVADGRDLTLSFDMSEGMFKKF